VCFILFITSLFLFCTEDGIFELFRHISIHIPDYTVP